MEIEMETTLIQLADVEASLKAFFPADDIDEMQYKINAHQESIDDEKASYGEADETPLDWYTAYRDCVDQAESALMDRDAGACRKSAREFLNRCRQWEAQVGILQPVSEDDARAAVRNGIGVKMSHFPKVGNQRYEFNTHPQGWHQSSPDED
jgi:hypothetical protein